MMHLTLEAIVGATPMQCYEQALKVAKRVEILVRYQFGDITCNVSPSGRIWCWDERKSVEVFFDKKHGKFADEESEDAV